MLTIDPTTLADPVLRDLITSLMNQIEVLEERVQQQANEIQRLRDENNRLRGEQGQPTVRPGVKPTDLASESERADHALRPHRRRARSIVITNEQRLTIDPVQLPLDAVFKGYQPVEVQEIVLQPQGIRFLREKWYSPSTHRTYVAPLPSGFTGQFGPRLRALALTLYFESGLSMAKLHGFLRLAGIAISTGQVSRLLTHNHDRFHAERQAILQAGLASSPWQQIDTTATRVNGANHHCHVLGNPLYTVYTTTERRDRLAALDVLRGGAPRVFRLNTTAESLLQLMGFPTKPLKRLRHGPRDQDMTLTELDSLIATHLDPLTPVQRKWLLDALAIAAYHAQEHPVLPIVRTLVCDDAPTFRILTESIAQCWVHDGRAYKRLEPRFAHHIALREAFCARYWAFYRELAAYRRAPIPDEAIRLRTIFEGLVATITGYQALDERIRITAEKKAELLLVLDHPEVPLHNNAAELGIRRRVRKRDVSYGPRRAVGVAAWDTFQSLAATAQQLGVNVTAYLYDTLCGGTTLPRLATIIAERAQMTPLGASWSEPAVLPAWRPKRLTRWNRWGQRTRTLDDLT